jgi:hypothetical protein
MAAAVLSALIGAHTAWPALAATPIGRRVLLGVTKLGNIVSAGWHGI